MGGKETVKEGRKGQRQLLANLWLQVTIWGYQESGQRQRQSAATYGKLLPELRS